MERRWAALVLAVALASPLLAPLVASARAGCARCAGAARCCCAPAQGAGGCRLARPCGPVSGGEGVMAPLDLQKGLPEAPLTPVVAADRPVRLSFRAGRSPCCPARPAAQNLSLVGRSSTGKDWQIERRLSAARRDWKDAHASATKDCPGG